MERRSASPLGLIAAVTIVSAVMLWPMRVPATQAPLSPGAKTSLHWPLYFEANQGQAAAGIDFRARSRDYTLDIEAEQVRFRQAGMAPVVMQLVNASPDAVARAEQPLPGRVHYVKGRSPRNQIQNIPVYGAVRYQDVFPGIDVAYYPTQGRLEYDFIIAPGADPRQIRLDFPAARSLSLQASGDLYIDYEQGRLTQQAPFIYQLRGQMREPVAGRYEIDANKHQVSFSIADYDPSRPLIIDPVLVYGSFYGGSGDDRAESMVRDNAGNFYLTGVTTSTDYPVTSGTASLDQDIFVTKLDATGALVYSIYIGGQQDDRASDIAVDAVSGEAYVTGATISHDFPVTPGSFNDTCNSIVAGDLQLYCQDGWQAFGLKLTAAGTISYATYLGGSGDDEGTAIAVDGGGNAYIAGTTKSIDFPFTAGVVQTALQALNSKDMFVVELNNNGTAETYATYLGGSADDVPHDLAVDAAGNVYLTGFTLSDDYPLQGAYDSSCAYDSACGVAIASRRVAVAGPGGVLLTSYPDSQSWVTQASGTINDLTAMVWGRGQYLAVGTAGTILTSTDGSSWTSQVSGTANALRAITWGGGQFVAVGAAGTILTSPNGVAWTDRSTGASNLEAVKWSGSQYVAVGQSGAVLTSPDAVTWTARTSGTTANLNGLAWGGGQFIAVGAVGTLLSSSDGVNWLAGSSSTNNNLAAIAWSGSQFVAAGAAGTIISSVDGVNWTARASGVSSDLLDVAWGTNGFGVSGASGTILLSDGGVNWAAWATGSATNLNALAWSRSLAGADAVVTKLNPGATALVYSTYLGGAGYDFGNSIFIDASDRAYIAGYTVSEDLGTSGVYLGELAGSDDAFIARLDAAGSGLDFLTYLGGRARDIAEDIFVDGAGNIYVTGISYSTDFPDLNGIQSRSARCTEKNIAPLYACNGDIFISRLQPNAVDLDYSFYLGGDKTDTPTSLLVTPGTPGQLYIAGYSNSANFPVTGTAAQATHADADANQAVDQSDIVFVQISEASGDLAVTMVDSADPITVADTVSYTITVTNNGSDTVSGVRLTSQLAGGLAYVSASGACSEDKGTVSCDIGELAASASAVITVMASPRQDGDYVSSAAVSGRVTDTVAGNNQASESTTVNLVTVSATAASGGSGAMDLLLLVMLALSSVTIRCREPLCYRAWFLRHTDANHGC